MFRCRIFCIYTEESLTHKLEAVNIGGTYMNLFKGLEKFGLKTEGTENQFDLDR